MRVWRISQTITRKDDQFSELLRKKEEVKFSGLITENNKIITGFLKQEPVDDSNSLVLYLKGYWAKDQSKIILLETTKVQAKVQLTFCTYIPEFINNQGSGYLDATDGPDKKGKYFFSYGDYLALTNILFANVSSEDSKEAEKKLNKMLNEMYKANAKNQLKFGGLFEFISSEYEGVPDFEGVHWDLVDVYPSKI